MCTLPPISTGTDNLFPYTTLFRSFLSGMYLFWNLWAGTNGFFFPYILRTVGNQTQAMSVAVRALSFLLGMASIFFIFMKLSDRVNQRLLFGLSAIPQVIGMELLAIFPLTLPVALIHVFLLAVTGRASCRER